MEIFPENDGYGITDGITDGIWDYWCEWLDIGDIPISKYDGWLWYSQFTKHHIQKKKHKNICFSISFSMMIMSPFPNHIIPNDKKSPVAVPIMPKRRAAGTNASDHPAPLGFSSR